MSDYMGSGLSVSPHISKHNRLVGSGAGHVCHISSILTVAHPPPHHLTELNRNVLLNAAARLLVDRLSLIESEMELSAAKTVGKSTTSFKFYSSNIKRIRLYILSLEEMSDFITLFNFY